MTRYALIQSNRRDTEMALERARSQDVGCDDLCDSRTKIGRTLGFYCQECGLFTPETQRYTGGPGDFCQGCGQCA